MKDASGIVQATALPKSESDVAAPQSAGTSATGAAAAAVAEIGTRIGNFRWVICGLLFYD